jgi:hypothetical protein
VPQASDVNVVTLGSMLGDSTAHDLNLGETRGFGGLEMAVPIPPAARKDASETLLQTSTSTQCGNANASAQSKSRTSGRRTPLGPTSPFFRKNSYLFHGSASPDADAQMHRRPAARWGGVRSVPLYGLHQVLVVVPRVVDVGTDLVPFENIRRQ